MGRIESMVECVEELRRIRNMYDDDTEAAHSRADVSILKFLAEHEPYIYSAYEEVREACGGFWYA